MDEFFEGTEKLLELWFSGTHYKGKKFHNLRDIARCQWEVILDLISCKILSYVSSDDMDSYLLSESSLFVSDNRLILKTCGQTSLLLAVPKLLKLVWNQTDFNVLEDVFYSHKKFQRPQLQNKVHQSFDNEVEYLESLFNSGSAYILGKMNVDCWYLYTYSTNTPAIPEQTLEVMMTNLPRSVMELFTKDPKNTAASATKESGILDIFDGLCAIDEYMFDPCGYSVNALLPEARYFTIHVTPQSNCSYVSFETNVNEESYMTLIKKLLKIFDPGKFCVTLFTDEDSDAFGNHKLLEKSRKFGETFRRNEYQFCAMEHYSVSYSQFTCIRPP